MKNEEIAKRVADVVYHNVDEKNGFATQSFVERIVLPDNVDGYTQEELENYILNFLNK